MRVRGFSLIEMAVVLLVIVLLLGGLLVPFTTQVEQRRIAETQKALEEVKEALVGYALSHSASATFRPYLPCPDATAQPVPGGGTPNDGREDRNGSACAFAEGNLPWVDLGVANADAWGNRFHYRVEASFSDSAGGFDLAALGTLRVCEDADPGAADPSCAKGPLADELPAVALSYGKNGYGAVNTLGGYNKLPTSTDEIENAGGLSDHTFISDVPRPAGTPAGEFDDLVAWVSPNLLFNRMVAAGRLP